MLDRRTAVVAAASVVQRLLLLRPAVHFVLIDGHLKLLRFDETFPLEVFDDSSERLFVHFVAFVFLEFEFDALAELYLRNVPAPPRLLDLIESEYVPVDRLYCQMACRGAHLRRSSTLDEPHEKLFHQH